MNLNFRSVKIIAIKSVDRKKVEVRKGGKKTSK